MAEKIINTRIQLKYDTWENWSSAAGQAYVLKAGEMGICAVPVTAPNGKTDKVLFKIGDGKTAFASLNWASAVAADVYDWAKAATKPTYTKAEVGLENVLNVESYSKTETYSQAEVNAKINELQSSLEADTDTQYKLVLEDHTLKLQSKAKDSETWTTTQSFTIVDSVVTGTANGTVAVNGTDVAVKGLGSAAYTDIEAYATAEQGDKADTAVQSVIEGTTNGTILVDGTEVAVHGLGDAAYKSASYFDTKIAAVQTAAEGAQSSADTAKAAADAAQATADNALPAATFESFKTTNTAAIADAKKAGTDAASALETYKTSNDAAVAQNATDISNLQTSVKAGVTFKGKIEGTDLPATTNYANGDLIIVGNKEYICYESGDTKSWIELGDEGSHLTKATADGYYVPLARTIAGVDLANNVTKDELRTALDVVNYSHPEGSAANKSAGFYKISTDANSHVASTEAVTKSDITALGIPDADTNQTVVVGTTTFGSNDVIKLEGEANITLHADADDKKILIRGISDENIASIAEAQINNHEGVDKVGTITAIQMNGETVGSEGVVDLGTIITDVSDKQDKLTTSQLAAVNSGVTATKVATYDGYASKISTLEGKAGLDKVGTVISVTAGEGLKITGTDSVSPKVEIDDEITFVLNCGGVND